MKKNFKYKIGIIGIGYVGLPLAINFSKYFEVFGYDKDFNRIENLNKGIDKNLDFKRTSLKSKKLFFTNNYSDLKKCNVYIITLPTPVDKKGKPDLTLIINATKKLAGILKKKDLVIYESTFYPGTIDDELIPILQKLSKLRYKNDFYVGYSPERINPGDKIHTLENITKVIASNEKSSLKKMKEIYNKIVKAGLYESSSIKVAELSKILENTQRFINIALINDISTLCNKMKIKTTDVINTASTKWNFVKYYPGLVGGHCIAVDPLYLVHKQKKMKVPSALIEVADNLNKKKHLEIIDALKNKYKNLANRKILILGLAFKENCPDLRNSGVLSLIKSLNIIKVIPFVHDPYVNKEELDNEISLKCHFLYKLKKSNYDCIILAVGHSFYKKMGFNKIKNISNNKSSNFFDLKNIFHNNKNDYQL